MSDINTKLLECVCVESIEGTCAGGGELSATLTLKEGAFFADIKTESKITSRAEQQLLATSLASEIEVTGSGPYYVIKYLDADAFSNLEVEVGWSFKVLGSFDPAHIYNVVNVYVDTNSILVYGIDTALSTWNSSLGDFPTQLSGLGHPTPPNIIRTRTFFPGQDLIAEGFLQRAPRGKIFTGDRNDLGFSPLFPVSESDNPFLQVENKFSDQDIIAEGEVTDKMTAAYGVSQDLLGEGEFKNTITDKIAGEFGDFHCLQKLFPSGDLSIRDGFGSLVGPEVQTTNLFSFIDEGVYEGVLKDKGDSNLLSDDETSFLHPNTIHTDGLFQYNCLLTDFNVKPEHTAFRMRVSAPTKNYESNIPPLYTVYNIRLSDPSGNLIVKYNDIQLRGDATEDLNNYATYSSLAQINVSDKNDWDRRSQPHMHMVSGYQLSFSLRAVALDDPFDPGFDEGFEENYIIPETFYASGNNYLALDGQPLSTQEIRFLNPTPNFKISSLEICNSGGYGPALQDFVPMHMPLQKKGIRLERAIKPKFMYLYQYDTTIYPSLTMNLWQGEGYQTDAPTNETTCGAKDLVDILRKRDSRQYIELTDIDGGGVADSGKLILKFGDCFNDVDQITKGAFNFEFDQTTQRMWWEPSGAFNVENRSDVGVDNIFYNFESITLKVLAKKENASDRDYIIDVVGYSDDKLLNNTSPSGGFLQNPSGIHLNDVVIASEGHYPVRSGFLVDGGADWTLAGASLSEKEDFFFASGNDHYKLTPYPVVNTTEFKWYEVPLEVVDQEVKFGQPTDHSMSSKLENIVLDIFPLPSGAAIACAELCVRYKPQNAFNMYSQGGENFGKAQDGRSEGAIFPSGRQSYDDILNAGSGFKPLSYLEGLPHLYSGAETNTLKTNYSRRWRGVEGTVRGPYDLDMFSFAFENPTIDYPFLSGYYKFDNIVDGYVQSHDLGPTGIPSGLGTSSGLIVGDINTYQNIGWRFASGTLFQDHLPGFSGNHTSTDWTALSNAGNTFVGNPMYGKIADAFDRVARVSGEAGEQRIDFSTIDTVSGFSIFLRFTPDSNVSGVDYDLFESGVLASQWDTPSDMGWVLGYEGGFLKAWAKDDTGNIVSIQDTQNYYNYTYPLSVLLTYNDNYSKKLKLYVDSETVQSPTWNILRDSSAQFDRIENNAPIVLGYSAGSGVGMNMLVSEFGISAYSSGVDTLYGSGTNIVEANSDATYKQVTADKFLENVRVKYFHPDEPFGNDRYKLWDRVNEDTYNNWQIGDFKFCEFGIGFDQWQKRPNTEQIVFHIKHHGSGYVQQHDLPLLPQIDSGVAYHTQMENDFLRFHLTDVADAFYSVNQRITKNIPCDYKFSERALVVETVIEHKIASGIKWPSCEDIPPSGPRMIVSLYSKNKEPYWTEDEDNWGLINRKVHYIKPSSCLIRLDSTFSYDDLIDQTESWATFPEEPRLREFEESYLSDDINQMFVQYDLVYPSGPAFESKLQMHSSHIRMADVNILDTDVAGSAILYTSGAFPANGQINLNIGGFPREVNETLPLGIQVPIPHDVFSDAPSGFCMNVSGAFQIDENLNLFIPPQSGNAIFNLNIAGQIPPKSSGDMSLALPNVFARIDVSIDEDTLTTPGAERGQTIIIIGGEGIHIDALASSFDKVKITDDTTAGDGSVSLSGSTLIISGDISGKKLNAINIQNKINALDGFSANGASSAGDGTAAVGELSVEKIGTNKNNLHGMNLSILNSEIGITPSGPYLNLSTFAPSGNSTGILTQLNTVLFNNIKPTTAKGSSSGTLNFQTIGGRATGNNRVTANMPLHLLTRNTMSPEMPLYIHNPEVESLDSGSMSLVTASYNVGSKGFGSIFGLWDGSNFGTGIEIIDNYLASIPVSNEIRGVDLTAFGSCTGDSTSKAIEKALVTDCTIWSSSICHEAGAFRAKDTYTNPTATNFEGGVGYSGNYYGIRKYTQLLPSMAYDAVMTIKTGDTDPISVPRDFEEWEYGMCGPDWYTHVAPGTESSGCCNEVCEQNIVFSGIKLVGDDSGITVGGAEYDPELLIASGRQAHAKFGSTVSVKGDLMAIAAPDLTIPDFDPNRSVELDPLGTSDPGTVDVSGAGSVFLYRRGADVAGQKANWTFIDQIMLPSGYRKDYIQRTANNLLNFRGLSISGNKWQLGQEGRRFGESLDMCSSGERETLVIGAPRAKWERKFVDIPISGITASTLVVADLFSYDKKKLKGVAGAAQEFNILWKYFSAPWAAETSDEWYAQVSTKVIVLQLTDFNKDYPDVPTDEKDWFKHKYIPRLDDLNLLKSIGGDLVGTEASLSEKIAAAQPVVFNIQFSGVKECLNELFPHKNAIYSGLPPILGMFKEQTGSTAGALKYTNSDLQVVSLYDEIEKYYNAWTYASGVRDMVQDIRQSGHINTIEGKSEDAYSTTRNLIRETFDSGRLSRTFTNTTLNRNFIASGVGQEWGDTHSQIRTGFQVPPASGGRVYIFEKERDNFNCVQVIVSPDDIADLSEDVNDRISEMYGFTPNDRFGHSVAISKNSEVITIGSPFKTTPVRIYERKEDENKRVYDRIREFCVSGGLSDAVNHYDIISLDSGVEAAKVSTYDHISASDRFSYRNNVNFWGTNTPQLYKLSFAYNYSDIRYVGTNKWLANDFAPTSRLGWSTAVSEDGNIAAFGAPTDSFNVHDDVNVWGTGLEHWKSFTHGGAVRVFESRKYHPHSGIVEFGRFGNLDRATHKEERDQGLYDQWDEIFGENADGTSSYKAKSFRRMDFSEITIPTGVGLCFITTPELDAASDEIIDNIKDWLALGDRNLVLVGNDPVWEEGGLYKESNDVINKVLKKLSSRMRITAAKDETYAMQGTLDGECVPQDQINDDKFNVTSVPPLSYTTGPSNGDSYGNFYGKGFGDIRIDLSQDNLTNLNEYFECPEGKCCDGCGDDGPPVINNKCEFPLAHSGDLRAQWREQCIKTTPRGCRVVDYNKNWPLEFGNFTPPCDDPPVPTFRKKNQEPVPILTTMEHLPPVQWYRPATSGKFCNNEPIFKWIKKTVGSTTTEFASHNVDFVDFDIQEDSDSFASGIFNSWNYQGDFVDPPVKNGRDGLVQGFGRSYYPEDEEKTETKVVYPFSILSLVESGRKDDGQLNSSRIYLIATQWSEDDNSRGLDAATLNEDKNTEFYINMVRRDCDTAPKGIQINGFTKQSSLSAAYYTGASSLGNYGLGDKLNFEFSKNDNQGYFRENQDVSDLASEVDFAWIAQPSGKPSDQEIARIKEWLDQGNKKLIITYNGVMSDSRQDAADNVNHICSGLNVTSRPFFIPSVGEYFETAKIISGYDREEGSKQLVDTATDAISGCDFGYGFSRDGYNFATSMSGVEFSPSTEPKDPTGLGDSDNNSMQIFVPLSGGSDYEKIIWFNDDITEQFTVYPTNRYKIDGNATIEFPVVKDSGYRMFINWVSETNSEEFEVCGEIEGATSDPAGEEGGFFGGGGDTSENENGCGTAFSLKRTTAREPLQRFIDLRATGDVLTIKLNTDQWKNGIPRDQITEGVLPATPRFLSISGCPLEIITETVLTESSGKKLVGYKTTCEWIVNPAQSGEVPGISRPVHHLSQPYCKPGGYTDSKCEEANFGETLIQDGPVVAAEEPEQFSSFPAGRRKSHIIVISDSTMIQGQCAPYRGSDAVKGNQKFIRSLYPKSPEDYNAPQDDGEFGNPDSSSGGGQLEIESFDNERNWHFAQKIRSPETASPAKYHAISGQQITNIITDKLWGAGGGGTKGNVISNFVDGEDFLLNPTLTEGRPAEERDPIKQRELSNAFNDNVLSEYGMWPRFSGDFLDIIADNPTPPEYYNELLGEEPPIEEEYRKETIVDANLAGGMSDLMKATNTDYLDFDVYYSGCAGDLFGYSIDLAQSKLIVGTPFNAYHASGVANSGLASWSDIIDDVTTHGHAAGMMSLAEDGGAGAAFIYNRTTSGESIISERLPWEFTQKIKPSSVNVGIYDFSTGAVSTLTAQRGSHQISDTNVIISGAKKSDQFGISVAMDCDMCVIGAPQHDFQTIHQHIYSGGGLENPNNIDANGLNTAFTRKNFTAAFDIPTHRFFDLGDSGTRVDTFENKSGVMVLNAGAVYNYRNKLVDFRKREQSWVFAQKIVPQSGYKGREQGVWGTASSAPGAPIVHKTSGNEFDNFGRSVSIYRAGRGDSDYTLVAGSPNHIWPVSGDHRTKDLRDAGAAFTYDAMLREQTASIPNSGGYIDAHVFAHKKIKEERIENRVYQNETGPQEEHKTSGLVFTNQNGDIFLEVSGFDPSVNGFIAHRPYVDNIKFTLRPAIEQNETLQLFIDGAPAPVSGDINMSILGADRANVYNNMGLNHFGVSGIAYTDGIDQSGLFLNISAPSGPIASSLNLNLTSTQSTGLLPLRIRGF